MLAVTPWPGRAGRVVELYPDLYRRHAGVTARPITVTADNLSRLDGNSNPAFTYTVSGDGLVNGDTLSGGLATTASSNSPAGAYPITQGALTAFANYAVEYIPGTLTVEVTATDTTRAYLVRRAC